MRAAALLLLSGAGLAGCAQPPVVLSVDQRVVVRPDSGVMVDTPLRISTGASGVTRVSIPLHNPGPHDLAVSCVADWFDAAGHPVGGLMAQPARIAVAAFAEDVCETVSPTPAAQSFRVMINPTA